MSGIATGKSESRLAFTLERLIFGHRVLIIVLFALVLDEGLHVLVLERQLLGERCVDAQAACRHRDQRQRHQHEHHHDDQAVAEDQLLERERHPGVRPFDVV